MQYRYRPRYRPPGFATLPAGLVWEFVEMPPDLAHRRPDVPRSSHRFGVIATARALTNEELERFELDVHEGSLSDDKNAAQMARTASAVGAGADSTAMLIERG